MRRLIAILGGLALAAGFVISSSPASASTGCSQYDEWGNCVVTIEVPGTDDIPTGNDGDGDGGGSGDGVEPPKCAWKLMDPQYDPPAGKSVTDGAWYESCAVNSTGSTFAKWFDEPPEETSITPGRAAAAVAARLSYEAFDIGMAPEVNSEWGHRRSYIGVPVWLWVANPRPEHVRRLFRQRQRRRHLCHRLDA